MSKEDLFFQRRAELADTVLESLADIDRDPEMRRLASVSQAAVDAIRIETLIGIINRLIGPDRDGVYHLAVQIDVVPEPAEHHVALGFLRTIKEPTHV